MLAKTVKVTDKGQISIPTMIRELIGIEKGDELLIVENNGKLLIEKVDKLALKVIDDFSDFPQLTEKSLSEIWDNKEDEIWNQYLKK
ncbi:MAG: AbrB/MazE/SpoVT family DNA-binding domain-containing protein [Nanoarchaeales archaeon]|nr:AbrB/MazE/SpoVT family DNA-binding domain-containing protein [Nanoarchaeales archaeon]